MDTDATTRQSATPRRAPRLPPRWIIRSIWALHLGMYAVTRGRFGLRKASADRAGLMLLRTVGRRTGKERRRFLASGLARHATGATIDVNGASYVR